MAVYEKTGLMTYIDENGNTYLLYPVTNADAVDGLSEKLEEMAKSITPADIGAVADTDIIPVKQGGTGVTTLPDILKLLHGTRDVTTYVATIGDGWEGGGYCTPQVLRAAMGLGYTTAALPIPHGGTNATTAEQARINLGAVRDAEDHKTDDLDNLTEVFTRVGMNLGVNAELYSILGDGYAHVFSGYYAQRSADSDRYQIAISYTNTAAPKIAFRIHKGAWGPWRKLLTNVLDASEYGSTLPSTGVTGQVFFLKG